MTDASIVAEPAYDQVLALSLEPRLFDGMAPPLRFVRRRFSLFDLP